MARILIVDDQRLVREALAIVLERENHEIQQAASGRAAIELCENDSPALVVTDILLPSMAEGFETIRRLRQLAPRLKIIAISGGGHVPSQDLLKTARDLGADRTFRKPIDVAEFVAAVADLTADGADLAGHSNAEKVWPPAE